MARCSTLGKHVSQVHCQIAPWYCNSGGNWLGNSHHICTRRELRPHADGFRALLYMAPFPVLRIWSNPSCGPVEVSSMWLTLRVILSAVLPPKAAKIMHSFSSRLSIARQGFRLQRPDLFEKTSSNMIETGHRQPDIQYHPDYAKYKSRTQRRQENESLTATLPEGFPAELSSPLVWHGKDVEDSDDWIYSLSEDQLEEIDAALAAFKGRRPQSRRNAHI